MHYKTEEQYINSLSKVDFDPCTLSVYGYAQQFTEAYNKFPDLLSFFFNHYHLFSSSAIENFLDLIWVSERLKEASEYLLSIKSMCLDTSVSVADAALKLCDHMSCESNLDIDLSFLLSLDIKTKYLKDYAISIYSHDKQSK